MESESEESECFHFLAIPLITQSLTIYLKLHCRSWKRKLKIKPITSQKVKVKKQKRWRRQGLWHHFRWRPGRKRPGRPPIPAETRELIRAMSRDNRLWGAPRIPSAFPQRAARRGVCRRSCGSSRRAAPGSGAEK